MDRTSQSKVLEAISLLNSVAGDVQLAGRSHAGFVGVLMPINCVKVLPGQVLLLVVFQFLDQAKAQGSRSETATKTGQFKCKWSIPYSNGTV